MKRLSALLLTIFFAAPLADCPKTAPERHGRRRDHRARQQQHRYPRRLARSAREQLYAEAKQQQDQTAAEQEAKEHEKDLLRDLIDQQLLLQKAQELGITADTELVKRLDELRKQMHADSMEDMEKAAQAQGISFEEFKQNLKNNILTQRVIGQEVGGHITVIATRKSSSTTISTRPTWSAPSRCGLSEILISTQTTPPVKNDKGETALPETPSPEVVAAGAGQGRIRFTSS